MSGAESHVDVLDDITKLDQKKKSFDKEFRALVKQCQETITAKYSVAMEFGNVRPELICLNRYLSIYNSMVPSEHFCYFESLYGRKRNEILNCLKDDRWIRTGNIIIQFGEGVKTTKEMEEKRKQVRIMLSDIFLIAYDLQLQAENLLDGVTREFADSSNKKDLIRPTILLLHLMRIFYHLNDGSDKEALGAIVSTLESDLGVVKKTVDESATTKPISIETGGLSGLFSMATNMMKKMGIEPPPGMKPPSETEIAGVLGNVFNNESAQNLIQGMFSSLKGCDNLGSAAQEIFKTLSDQGSLENLQESLNSTNLEPFPE